MLRLSSLTASASCIGRLCEQIAHKAEAFQADAVLWVTNHTKQPERIARAISDVTKVAVGGISTHGLIGGFDWCTDRRGVVIGEHYAGNKGCDKQGCESRVVALALSLRAEGMGALPFHSACDGLPELPAWAWEKYITSPPSDAPNMLLLAAPPTDGKFAMEKWLQRLDSTLPYSQKVGGITAGDTRLFVGEKEHDGGAVGLALNGVQVETLVCHGSLPVGPSFEITTAQGNQIQRLDGRPVGEVVGPLLREIRQQADSPEAVGVMAGITVPSRPAVGGAATGESGGSSQVIRAVVGYSEPSSVLAVGVTPELLREPGARLQLHAFSARNARAELAQKAGVLAARAGGGGGGLMMSCLGRGEALSGGWYGEAGVETKVLHKALRRPVGLAGMFGGGQIAPVGARTFFHTYTTTVAMLRDREA